MSVLQTWGVQNDGVIVWDASGQADVVPGGGESVERWYPGWDVRCSPWDNIIVWNNAGTAEVVSPGLSEPVRGGKGDNDGRRRRIVKPTGLVDRKPEVRKGVDERVAETEVIAEGVAERFGREFTEDVEASGPVEELSLADIEREIGAILRKKLRTDDDEILLLMLMAVASARWR